MADLTVALNVDTSDSPYLASGIDWVDMVTGESNDYLIFSNGSDVVVDRGGIPSQSSLIQAGCVLTGVQQVVPKYFLADISAALIKEIHNMGNVNKRYTMAFSFDGATASEPVLELWDDNGLDTILATTLGAGTASSSWWRGIVTTDALPGADWALSGSFSRLAGSSDGYFLWLNNEAGALTGADVLYCNLAIVIPASVTTGGSANPLMCVKYNSN